MVAIGETRARILQTLKIMDRPMTVKMIAKDMGVTDQTVRNHMPNLQNQGKVELWKRHIDGASAYVLSDSANATRYPITWMEGETNSLRDIFETLAKSGDMSRNPFWHNLQRVIIGLYRTAVMSVDDVNPQSPTLMELREMRNVVTQVRDMAGDVRQAANDLLDNEELWDPRKVTKALILNDQNLDIERARDFLDRLD